jgi:hypothetical protein
VEGSDEYTGITPVTVDFDAVARVASRVQLTGVSLVSCNAEITVPTEEIKPDWSSSVFIGHQSHVHGWRRDESGASPEAILARVAFIGVHHPAWDLDVMEELPPYEADDPPAVLLDVMFELVYEPREDGAALDPEDLEHFAFVNATFNAWPYWRELAQSMTQRMGIPPVVVPVFKIPSAHDPE